MEAKYRHLQLALSRPVTTTLALLLERYAISLFCVVALVVGEASRGPTAVVGALALLVSIQLQRRALVDVGVEAGQQVLAALGNPLLAFRRANLPKGLDEFVAEVDVRPDNVRAADGLGDAPRVVVLQIDFSRSASLLLEHKAFVNPLGQGVVLLASSCDNPTRQFFLLHELGHLGVAGLLEQTRARSIHAVLVLSLLFCVIAGWGTLVALFASVGMLFPNVVSLFRRDLGDELLADTFAANRLAMLYGERQMSEVVSRIVRVWRVGVDDRALETEAAFRSAVSDWRRSSQTASPERVRKALRALSLQFVRGQISVADSRFATEAPLTAELWQLVLCFVMVVVAAWLWRPSSFQLYALIVVASFTLGFSWIARGKSAMQHWIVRHQLESALESIP